MGDMYRSSPFPYGGHMDFSTLITPGAVVASTLFLWRVLGKRIDDLREDVRDLRRDVTAQGERLARIEGRLEPARPPDA